MRNVLTVLFLIFSGCGRVPVRTDLSTSISEAVAKGDATVVDLGKLADFEWNEVCFLGPFMRPSDISTKLGFEWNDKRSGARGSLVFVNARVPRSDSAATGHLPIQRNQWFIQASGCIPRAKAKFLVRSKSGGPAMLVPEDPTHRNPSITPSPNLFIDSRSHSCPPGCLPMDHSRLRQVHRFRQRSSYSIGLRTL